MRFQITKKLNFLIIFFLIGLFFNLTCFKSKQVVSFNEIFEKEKEISLQTRNLEIGTLLEIKTDFYNNFIFLDFKGHQILVFNQEGKFLKRIGGKGQGPGEFMIPMSIETDRHGSIFTSDNPTRRINKYDKEGNFIDSFIISSTHFTPNIIKIDSKNNLFLGGYKQNVNDPGASTWINKYDSKGKYIKSFVTLNTNLEWIARMYPSFCFDMDEEDIIYSVQIYDYKISAYNSEGKLLRTFAKAPSYFIKPDPNLKLDYSKPKSMSERMKEMEKLSKSWTKIFFIKVFNKKYLLLGLETNNLIKEFNKKYVIDIWDKKGNLIAGGIQTDYKFLCTDKDDYVYFLTYTDEEEPSEEAAQYKIGKYRLKTPYNSISHKLSIN